ncbi:MAG: AMP-binding protein [Candidatus Binatia bacterium]
MLRNWQPRTTAPELAARYVADGQWTDATLAAVLSEALWARRELTVRIWSEVRPFQGTVGRVHDLARRMVSGLRARGIRPGDVVAFQLPNWVEAAATFWALAQTGAVLVPIVHFYGPKEVSFILRQSGARAFITADRFRHLDYVASLSAVRSAAADLELVVVVGDAPRTTTSFAALTDYEPDDRQPDLDPNRPAIVAYTSGTTSDPKGAVHTHHSIVSEIRQLAALQAPNELPSLIGAPVGHFIGMLAGLLLPIARGVPIHLTDVWNPALVLKAVATANLTAGGGSTYFLTSLLDHPDFGPAHLERIRYVGLGGAPVPAAIADRAAALGISIFRSFGCSEHPSITGSAHDDPPEKRKYTDGAPLPGVEIRLVDGAGHEVARGEPGEILSRGPDLFAGYTEPTLTAEAFDANGWYATGDIGVLDEHGWLTITDRKKDIIIRGGENISAGEVEELMARIPGVAEVAVVAAPDPRLGEHACAFVRPLPGTSAPTLATVRTHLEAAGLTRQKWPEEIRAATEFPRTPSGKIKKFVLRNQLRAALKSA